MDPATITLIEKLLPPAVQFIASLLRSRGQTAAAADVERILAEADADWAIVKQRARL